MIKHAEPSILGTHDNLRGKVWERDRLLKSPEGGGGGRDQDREVWVKGPFLDF